MNQQTLDAIDASITHWEEVANTTHPSKVFIGGNDCPLCVLFFQWDKPDDYACQGCPIKEATEQPNCYGSPYYEVAKALIKWRSDPTNPQLAEAFRAAAQEELEFLKSLKPKTN